MKNKFNLFLEGKGISKEQFAEKSAEELAGLYNEYNEANYAALEASIAAKATSESIDSLKSEIKEAQIEQLKSLNLSMKEMGLQIKKLSEKDKDNGAAVKNTLRKGLEENIDKLKGLQGSMTDAQNSRISIKAVGDMSIAGNVSGGNVPVEQRLAGFNTIASRRLRLMDIVARGKASSNVISWVYQSNKQGAAGGTAEGAIKNQIDFDLVVASQSVKKRTAFIKVTTEMLTDIDFIESEIRNELTRELLKDVETQVYSGNNAGENLNGIFTTASAFVAGSFALSVDNANEADVLTVAANQIAIADQPMPNYILMHPTDVTKLKLYKVSNTDKRYIDRLSLIAGQMSLDGIQIVETTLVTVGTYLIGSFDLATVYDKGDVTIDIGLDGNDFTNNFRTILIEWRGLVIVKNNDRTAFVKGTFATDKASIETP